MSRPVLSLCIRDTHVFANPHVQYEMWNMEGYMIRLYPKNGTWVCVPCMEHTLHTQKRIPMSVSKDTQTCLVRVFFQPTNESSLPFHSPVHLFGLENEAKETHSFSFSNQAPDIEFDFPLSLLHPIAFHLRLYLKSPLRYNFRHPQRDRWVWIRAGDCSVSFEKLFQTSRLPLFIPSDIYVYQRESEIKRIPLLESYSGHQHVFVHLEPEFKVKFPTEESVTRMYEHVFTEMIEKEWDLIHSIPEKLWSPLTRSLPEWDQHITLPPNFRLSGKLLLPLDADEKIAELGGSSAQSYWYIRSLAPHPSLRSSLCMTQPAAVEAWFQVALRETLEIHGSSLDSYIQRAKKALAPLRTSASTSLALLTPEWRELMSLVMYVIKSQCTTRPYVNDRNMVFGKWVSTDEKTPSFALPGDCEDNAHAVYQLYMTLLFHDAMPWQTEEIQLLRQLAACAGFPCGVFGTAIDPTMTLGVHDQHKEDGHAYTIILPFGTLMHAIQPTEQISEAQIKQFHTRFGIFPPLFHTKPAILESIHVSTPYYSDHHFVSPKKRNAHDVLATWLSSPEIGEDEYAWKQYTQTNIMGKHHVGQGIAYRLFTEALYMLFSTNAYPSCLLVANGKSKVVCRSFVFYQPYAYTKDEVLSFLFPVTSEDRATYADDLNRIVERLVLSRGYGVPVELLSHGTQQTPNGTPMFHLLATCEFDHKVVEEDRQLVSLFERPLCPLYPHAIDAFAEDALWKDRVLSSIPSSLPVPSDSNDRIILYVYDILGDSTNRSPHDLKTWKQHVSQLQHLLGSKGVVLRSYQWSVACIFIL